MKKILIGALIALSTFSSLLADTYVNGYTKNNGTYVAPYYRSSPNSTRSDNYSTKGNTNPYTGQAGTKSNDSSYGSSSSKKSSSGLSY